MTVFGWLIIVGLCALALWWLVAHKTPEQKAHIAHAKKLQSIYTQLNADLAAIDAEYDAKEREIDARYDEKLVRNWSPPVGLEERYRLVMDRRRVDEQSATSRFPDPGHT